MLRKSILAVLIIVIAILMLCSCDGSEETQETSKPEQRPMSQGEAERDYYIFASTQMKKSLSAR